METSNFYNEILTEHNIRPYHKHDMPDATFSLNGVNPSCGDDITLKLKVVDDVIEDASFIGDGCAISQASADIMADMVIGRSKEEALRLAEMFIRMIKGSVTNEEIDELDKMLYDYEQKSTNVIVIVSISENLTEDNFSEYALKLANNWAIGQADKNNGLLLIYSAKLRYFWNWHMV